MKKFEPHYRLVRYELAKKIEKASRQQRMSYMHDVSQYTGLSNLLDRQATQEQIKGVPWHSKDQGCQEEEGINECMTVAGLPVNNDIRKGWCFLRFSFIVVYR